MDEITGKHMIDWGFEPGSWFKKALQDANTLHKAGYDHEFIKERMHGHAPLKIETLPLRTNTLPFTNFLAPSTEDEIVNHDAVVRHFDVLMRTPTIVKGAIMPDACPSGSAPGTIPVGGVVATKNAIHPGFHSADVCCSMAMSIFKREVDVAKILDAAMKVTHFGPTPKKARAPLSEQMKLSGLLEKMDQNPFLKGLNDQALNGFMTQGDGNHFLYVGRLASTGEMVIVTHHGSRGVGGELYKRGKAVAEKNTRIHSPETPKHNAWITADSIDGMNYWSALQLTRTWTKMNHLAIHDALARELGVKITDQMWNEHNFVFRRADGLFYHAKGATPSYGGFSPDDNGMTLIPLNMGQPILITRHTNNPDALGFAPHGAGRNISRTAHIGRLKEEFGADARGLSPRDLEEIIKRETKGIDTRFYTGNPDVSELPSAYKRPGSVVDQIRSENLAEIADTIEPLGSLMAGEFSNYRRGRQRK